MSLSGAVVRFTRALVKRDLISEIFSFLSLHRFFNGASMVTSQPDKNFNRRWHVIISEGSDGATDLMLAATMRRTSLICAHERLLPVSGSCGTSSGHRPGY